MTDRCNPSYAALKCIFTDDNSDDLEREGGEIGNYQICLLSPSSSLGRIMFLIYHLIYYLHKVDTIIICNIQ